MVLNKKKGEVFIQLQAANDKIDKPSISAARRPRSARVLAVNPPGRQRVLCSLSKRLLALDRAALAWACWPPSSVSALELAHPRVEDGGTACLGTGWRRTLSFRH